MKLTRSLFLTVLGSFFLARISAQNMLPAFSVKELTRGKIQVSWNNPYQNCIQLAIQRSFDSSKNFRTIFSAQSPQLAVNGYVDNHPLAGERSYYRIFYVIQGGAYFFTPALAVETTPAPGSVHQPVTEPMPVNATDTKKEPDKKLTEIIKEKDLVSIYLKKTILFKLTQDEYKHFKDSINKTKDALHRIDEHSVEWRPAKTVPKNNLIEIFIKDDLVAKLDKKNYQLFSDSVKIKTKDTLFSIDDWRKQLHLYAPPAKPYIYIYRNDSLVMQVDPLLYKKIKDSISTRTKDTLYAVDNNHIAIHPFAVKYAWKPSEYIFTNAKGFLTILLPLVKQHKYHVIFYEEDGTELFRIKTIKEPELILDKTNFIHAGWFSFELFEDDKLKEKNKFMLSKD